MGQESDKHMLPLTKSLHIFEWIHSRRQDEEYWSFWSGFLVGFGKRNRAALCVFRSHLLLNKSSEIRYVQNYEKVIWYKITNSDTSFILSYLAPNANAPKSCIKDKVVQ